MNANQLYTAAGMAWLNADRWAAKPESEDRSFYVAAYGRSYSEQIELARIARQAS